MCVSVCRCEGGRHTCHDERYGDPRTRGGWTCYATVRTTSVCIIHTNNTDRRCARGAGAQGLLKAGALLAANRRARGVTDGRCARGAGAQKLLKVGALLAANRRARLAANRRARGVDAGGVRGARAFRG